MVNAVWMVAAVLGVAKASFADGPFCNRMKPVPQTAKFIDPDFFIWGASMVQDKEGLCHLFYSRWPREARPQCMGDALGNCTCNVSRSVGAVHPCRRGAARARRYLLGWTVYAQSNDP